MNGLRKYLALVARRDELTHQIFEGVCSSSEADENIAKNKKEMGEILDKIKKMERVAGFATESGRVRAVSLDGF